MSETTKNFLQLIKYYKIVIPLIQRDYAQGRVNEKQKAKKFLTAIKDGCEKGLNLDFIYGRKSDTTFTPIDGQQRLTTLFLLHWYLSIETDYISDLKKFSYEVRSTTKDFINELTKQDNWKNLKKENIGEQVENSNWFFSSWKNDPTVASILNMLELIEKYFCGIDVESLDKITFEILFLDEFKLTDELYVKMNARGKPLTEFENFKAEFEKYITDDKVKAKLDNDWLNIFWNISKSEKNDYAPIVADKKFYQFFYNATLNFYLEQNENKFNKEFLQEKSLFDFYKDVYENKNKITEIITILDSLENFDEKVFTLFIGEPTYSDRAKFYALSLGYIHKLNAIEFKRWNRVSFNLINNQRIDEPQHFVSAIQSLTSLVKESNHDIYGYINNKPETIKYFSEIQRKEESLKAKLIENNHKWENELQKAEEHSYLNGQIGFLLKFANNDLNEFIHYRNKFTALWKCSSSKDNQILIYQALLTKGDYLPPHSRQNHTFCSFEIGLRAKMYNWRKVFNNEKQFIKHLLDDENFSIDNTNESLEKIIDKFEFDKNNWKSYFIKNKSYIEYCTKLFIRHHTEGEIRLLRTTQLNGKHVELRSWNLFKKKLEKEKYEPFKKIKYREKSEPCIYLDGFQLQDQSIELQLGWKKNSFYLEVYAVSENEEEIPLNNEIQTILKEKGFNEYNKKININENDVMDELTSICEKINNAFKGSTLN